MQFCNCELRSRSLTFDKFQQIALGRFCQTGNFFPIGQLEATSFERWAATRFQRPEYTGLRLVPVDSLQVEYTLRPDESVFETPLKPEEKNVLERYKE